jgi:RNA polymerase sigma-70 factor (sigma-E family)
MRVRGVLVDSARQEPHSVTVSSVSPVSPTPPTFDEFVRDSHIALVRYATLLSGSAAQGEDLVQEVLVRLYPRWDALSAQTGSIGAYVRRAVTNEHISWRRRWSTRHIRLADDGDLPEVPVAGIPEARDEELWQRLLVLPPQQRAAVVLRYYEDLDDDEIAVILDCRPTTVRAHVSRGLAALRRNNQNSRGGSRG